MEYRLVRRSSFIILAFCSSHVVWKDLNATETHKYYGNVTFARKTTFMLPAVEGLVYWCSRINGEKE